MVGTFYELSQFIDSILGYNVKCDIHNINEVNKYDVFISFYNHNIHIEFEYDNFKHYDFVVADLTYTDNSDIVAIVKTKDTNTWEDIVKEYKDDDILPIELLNFCIFMKGLIRHELLSISNE
jgi:hypothetical protein